MAKTILVVDDSRMARTLAKAILEELRPDWTIEVATDGADALAKVSGMNGVDGILLDINMPGLDGFHVAEILRDRFRELPIFFASANVQSRVQKRASERGFGFISKPVDPSKLDDFVSRVG